MADTGQWWTAPTQSESGRLIMVTGRNDVKKFMDNTRFNIRVTLTWHYSGDSSGMPDKPTSELMEQAQDRLITVFAKDPVAVLTGIYTGDDERNWVFYTLSLPIFGKKLNEALADLPLLPIDISAENDSEWNEYKEMSEARINID